MVASSTGHTVVYSVSTPLVVTVVTVSLPGTSEVAHLSWSQEVTVTTVVCSSVIVD